MFRYEAQMGAPVRAWMEADGLLTRSEVGSSRGPCDLVGVSFSHEQTARRLALGQRKRVPSDVAMALLSAIPDHDTGKSVSFEELYENAFGLLSADLIRVEVERLIKRRFVLRGDGEQLQKLNGWCPLHERIVAVELKLHRVEEAIQQAIANLAFATHSYIGLPEPAARRLVSSTRSESLRQRGVGVLSVAPDRCEVLVPASPSREVDQLAQMVCAEQFWIGFLKTRQH